MRKMITAITLTIVMVAIAIFSWSSSKSSLQSNTSQTTPGLQKNYGKIPLYFEKNEGQADPQIDFISRGQGYGFYIKATESLFNVENNLLTMKLENANDKAKGKGINKQMTKVNYLSGNDPKAWKTGITTYAKVQYDNVYPGIDVIYYGNQKKIEYDFVVAPHADYSQIKLKFNGVEKLAINEAGDLVLTVAEGKELIQQKPEIYQEHNHQRQKIDGSYVLKGKDEVTFTVAAYDRERTLVIDPTLVYSTYLGGSYPDTGNGIAVDAMGSAYVTGSTTSLDFPISSASVLQTNNAGDSSVFISKLSPDGSSLLYSTYIGGSGIDTGQGIVVDSAGSAYITGWTESDDFPTTPNAFQTNDGGGYGEDAFVAKLNADGSALIYSSYLGGTGHESGSAIAIDSTGSAYITGWAESVDLPTTPNAFQANFAGAETNYQGDGNHEDAFVAKFSPDGSSLIYSSYLGGYAEDRGFGIAVDSAGSAYVTGLTGSGDFPTEDPYQASKTPPLIIYNAFVTQFSADGSSLIFSSYFGGGGLSQGRGIAVDSTGFIYVTGSTNASNFATANAYQTSYAGGGYGWGSDAFVAKLNPGNSSLVYATYLGGSDNEVGIGIVVDATGSAYVTGGTSSPNFPTSNAYQVNSGGYGDAFVAKLSPSGSSLFFSSYLGGNASDSGQGIAVDSTGSAYVTGGTSSPNFPTSNAYQANFSGTYGDAFVLKFDANCGTWYQDSDGDGYGNSAVSVQDCNPPSGYVQVSGDCHDGKPHVNPGRSEICNHSDDNCNNQIDEGFWWSNKQCLKLQLKKSPFMSIPPKKQNKK